MSYARGFLDKRIEVLNRSAAVSSDFGRTGGDFVTSATIWANCAWNKGLKAMREGAIDAYDVYMVRCDWHTELTRESRLKWDGKVYQILSFNGSKRENEIQIICQELVK